MDSKHRKLSRKFSLHFDSWYGLHGHFGDTTKYNKPEGTDLVEFAESKSLGVSSFRKNGFPVIDVQRGWYLMISGFPYSTFPMLPLKLLSASYFPPLQKENIQHEEELQETQS